MLVDGDYRLRDAQACLVYLASRYDTHGVWYPDDARIRGAITLWGLVVPIAWGLVVPIVMGTSRPKDRSRPRPWWSPSLPTACTRSNASRLESLRGAETVNLKILQPASADAAHGTGRGVN